MFLSDENHLLTFLWFQVFLSNNTNLYAITWFQINVSIKKRIFSFLYGFMYAEFSRFELKVYLLLDELPVLG